MARPIEGFDPKGVQEVNPMYDLSGQLKQFCTGCGGPRDVEFAKTNPCFCCGSFGTQKTQPEWDEFGELVPAEVVAARKEVEKQARIARLQAGREAKAAAIPAEVAPKVRFVEAKPAPEKPARVSSRQPNLQTLPKAKAEPPKAASLAALFL